MSQIGNIRTLGDDGQKKQRQGSFGFIRIKMVNNAVRLILVASIGASQ